MLHMQTQAPYKAPIIRYSPSLSLTMFSMECFGCLMLETGVKEAAREAFASVIAFCWASPKKPMHDIGVQCDLIHVAPTVVHCTEPQLCTEPQ